LSTEIAWLRLGAIRNRIRIAAKGRRRKEFKEFEEFKDF